MAPVLMVPAEPSTQMGRSPAARSATIMSRIAATSTRKSSPTGTGRKESRPMPMSSRHLVTQLWISVEP